MELSGQGMSQRAVANEVGVSESTVFEARNRKRKSAVSDYPAPNQEAPAMRPQGNEANLYAVGVAVLGRVGEG